MTDAEREDLASLLSHQGFRLLLDILVDEIRQTENLMSECKDGAEALRLLRYWQVLLRVSNLIGTAPQDVKEELERIRREAPFDDGLDALARRPFAPAWPQPWPWEAETTEPSEPAEPLATGLRPLT